MIDIKLAIAQGMARLQAVSSTPRVDAELLLAFVLKSNRTYLYTHSEAVLTEVQQHQYQVLLENRYQGHPMAYLLGTREFWSLSLQVTSDTLIPRPETELLVELILMELGDAPNASILELGTGSGAIALALATARPSWVIDAFDLSEAALAVARQNAIALGLEHVHFGESDWFQSIPPRRYQAIVSNPPYIASGDPHLSEGDLRFEPLSALASGPEGLDALSAITATAPRFLQPGGTLFVEHGCDQKQAVAQLFERANFHMIRCWPDYQGHDRVTTGVTATYTHD